MIDYSNELTYGVTVTDKHIDNLIIFLRIVNLRRCLPVSTDEQVDNDNHLSHNVNIKQTRLAFGWLTGTVNSAAS